jgi:signal transduction histidine kinase
MIGEGAEMAAAISPSDLTELEILLSHAATPEQRVDAIIAYILVREERDVKMGHVQLIPLAREALELARTAGYQQGQLNALVFLIKTLSYNGTYDEVLHLADEAETLALALGDTLARFRIINSRGVIHMMIGSYDVALHLYMQLKDFPDDLIPQRDYIVYSNIGALCIRRGEFDKARHETHRALDCALNGNWQNVRTHVINEFENLAYIEVQTKNPARAHTVLDEAEAYCNAHGLPLPNGMMLIRSMAYLLDQDMQSALDVLEKARHTSAGMEGSFWLGIVEMTSGDIHLARGDMPRAEQHFLAALHIFETHDVRDDAIDVHHRLSALCKRQGRFEEALAHYERFHMLREARFNQQADVRYRTLQALHEVETARIEQRAAVERADLLHRELDEREQTIAALDSYARNVAHDLKNPISSIYMATQLLTLDENMPADEVERIAMLIFSAAGKANDIIDTLLEVARIRREEMTARPVEMNAVIDEVIHRLEHIFRENGVVLHIEQPLFPVMGDPRWLEEVWINFMTNAVKYGGKPPHITIRAEAYADQVCYSIRDNGDGISPAEQTRLFSSFSRLERHKHTHEGHGLGLNIIGTIIEKLGGRVWVESDGIAGQGACFCFTLPAANNAS